MTDKYSQGCNKLISSHKADLFRLQGRAFAQEHRIGPPPDHDHRGIALGKGRHLIALDELDDGLMLKHSPGLFCAGEMLDWDAPTGGYLLTACLASGRQAAHGILTWLA